jgi:dTDP-4-amino-4,6-dideoxygalactose transaminase
MEIGGEFWIEYLPSEYNDETPEWINRFGKSVLTSSGRGAISLLLEGVEAKTKTALLPAYTCETVILPFIEHGYTCYFYDINRDMTPNLESIESYDDIGIFLHMGFYGFPTNSGLTDLIRRLKDEVTIIVEDITHTLFSDYKRFDENDYYVGSLRKWMSLPSGGFLASKMALSYRPKSNEAFADIRKKALQIKAHYMKGNDEGLKQQFLNLFAKGEEVLDSDLTPYNIDAISKTLLSVIDAEVLKEKRRSNFTALSEGLKDVGYIEPVFSDLSVSVCPMFYPIYIKENRSEIRQKLIEQKVYCPIHWPVMEQLKIDNLKNTEKIYGTVLSIPCDQRYGANDMKRVIEILRGLQIYTCD